MGLLNIGSTISGIAGIGSGLAQSLLGPKRDGAKSNLNLETFKSRLNKNAGLYKPSLFMVQIHPHSPSKFFYKGEGKSQLGNSLMYFCNSAALPGVQILSSDHRRQGFGTFDRRPFGVQVTDIPLTFFVDNDGEVLKFFDRWTNHIVNRDVGHDTSFEHAQNSTGQQLFEVGYRESYLSRIDIYCLSGDLEMENPDGGHVLHYRLHEAFPIQVGDLTVAWSETDAFSILPAQFTFRSFTVKRLSISDRPRSMMGDRAFSIPQALGLIAGGAGIIGSFEGISKQGILSHATNVLANRKILTSATGIF